MRGGGAAIVVAIAGAHYDQMWLFVVAAVIGAFGWFTD